MTVYFPGVRYGPNGEKGRFEREEDVPKGWHRNTPEGLAKLELKGVDTDPDDLSDLTVDELEALATAESIDIDAIEGSGKGGNVLKKDIIAAIEAKRGE